MDEEAATAGTTVNADIDTGTGTGRLLLVMEQRSLARYPLCEGQRLSIGRAEDCDIVLSDPMASRLHCTLRVDGEIQLEDEGSRNGSFLRDERIAAYHPVRLQAGDSVQIGSAILVVQAVRSSRLEADGAPAPSPRDTADRGVVLRDPAMRDVYALIGRIAPGNISVLILGETGVGKEVIAETVHRCSSRSQGPFVRVNCAALNESLFESELFGHERGAFTGASRTKPGLLEVAHTGTAFLDEVGELPLSSQAKLLRALEAGEITRVGGLHAQAVDIRFMAATNRDLRAEVARGSFREDLFFRLAGATVSVPPLRQRPSELVPLVEEFLVAVSAQLDRAVPGISEAAMTRLRAHNWPGNIRELRNVIECAVLRANGANIEPADLPPELLDSQAEYSMPWGTNHTGLTMTPPADGAEPPGLTPPQRADRERILAALSACNGNQTRAAMQLGIPRRTFVTRLGAYGIPRPRKMTPVPR